MAELKRGEDSLIGGLSPQEIEYLAEEGVSIESDDESTGEASEQELSEAEEEAKENHEQETNRQQNQDTETTEEDQEIEQLRDMAGGEWEGEITIPEGWRTGEKFDDHHWNSAVRKGKSLSRILRSKLQSERKSSRQYGLREGTLETAEISDVVAGNQNIRSRKIKPEDKDYSVQIILDRSGSMRKPMEDYRPSYDRIRSAQVATVQMAIGLYETGVDVSVMSLYDKRPHLEVPFGADPQNFKNRLVSGMYEGGTPLLEMLKLAETNISEGEGTEEFIIVICDGDPHNKREYKQYLEKMNTTVFGIYLNEDESRHGRHDQYFDVCRSATPENVDEVTRGLCQGLIGY